MDIYAKPEDRDQISLYVREIETDHKPGPDGTLMAFDKIIFGKKGTNGYEQIYAVDRLKKDNPQLWSFAEPLYLKWKEHQTLVREGLDLKAWPAITKGQIKACEGLGLFTVEDIASATSAIRDKLGMGGNELVDKAKAFVANKDASATAVRLANLESVIASQAKDLETAQQTIDSLMAERGQKPVRPKNREKEAA
jgi:hypothetical protein